MKISKEVKVGILAVAAIVTLYFGFNFLKGTDTFSKNYDYVTIFDNVGSLQPSNPVKLNGVNVGRIKSTQILPDQSNSVLVVLEVNKAIPLYEGTKVILTSELLGGSALLLNIPANITKKLNEGDTVIAVKEIGIQSLIQGKALPVLRNADSLIVSLNKVINQFDQTGYALNRLLTTTDHTAKGIDATVQENRVIMKATFANLSTLSASLIETEKGIQPILGNLKTTTDSLKALQLGKTLQQANATIATLQRSLAKLETGQGTAGKLLKDEDLYINLNRTVVSLNKLMTNFREQPKRYVQFSVFGKKDKGPAESALDTTSKE
jgi:phospholipid/cholesterol/gamma-HCH transport system substrate-binding protein